MGEVFFYFFSVISVVFAVIAVISRNVMRGGIALLGCFISLGAVYFTVGAEFLGIVQVIVYGGTVMVLCLFGLMMVDLTLFKSEPLRVSLVVIGGVLAVTIAFFILASGLTISGSIKPLVSTAKNLAQPMFFKFFLPFGVVSVLLLVATVGVVAIGRGKG
jgi:NADH-quinone oxidoreductase subunit J